MVYVTSSRSYRGRYTIMRPEIFPPKRLRSLLRKQRMATLQQLKIGLGTRSTMTVFRKLKGLGYLSSYSHSGQYYTLRSIPRFDTRGLWSCQSVRFSKFGNLQQTALALVEESDEGYRADELTTLLQVDVKHALLTLERKRQLKRESIGERWVYFGRRRATRLQQKRSREATLLYKPTLPTPLAAEAPEFREGLMAFFGLLDERQRRLFAGLQAAQLGHGGDRIIAELLGLDVHTVAKGRQEAFSGQSIDKRLRKKGGGRKSVQKKHRTS